MPPTPVRRRSIVYVDGLNLYYGALRGTPNRWLNLQSLFEALRPDDDIVAVKFFTARVSSRDSMRRQDAYLAALRSTPKVEIHLGRFDDKNIDCRVSGCSKPFPRSFSSKVEKKTDVALAVAMIDDAYRNRWDVGVLVTEDSDQVPTLTALRAAFGDEKTRVLIVPPATAYRGQAYELRSLSHKHSNLNDRVLAAHQFPPTVKLADGVEVSRPAEWS